VKAISFELQPAFPRGDKPSQALIIRLSVGMDFALDMLPYPTARRSVVTRPIYQQALGFPGEGAQLGRGLLLQNLRIAGESIPDLLVRPSADPSRLQVDGFLGLDFFSQFDVVEWHPKTHMMRLTNQ
jgi:hypothetical protein